MHPFHRSLGFLLTVSLGVLCYASSAIGQQKSTTQSSLNKGPFPEEPLQAVPNGLVQPNGPTQTSAPKQSSASAPSIDPFETSDDPEPMRRTSSTASDPFDPILSEVAKTLNEPIPFASLSTGELAKMEEKIRTMRISVLTNAIEVVSAKMDIGNGSAELEREYAELTEDLTTLEFQKAKSSVERQAAIQKAIDAWRLEEKIASARMRVSSTLDYYFAAKNRLRWEQSLVKELRAAAEAKITPQPVNQYPTVPQQTVYYPSVQPATVVGQPSPTYYYPSQPTYQYPRSYRSR